MGIGIGRTLAYLLIGVACGLLIKTRAPALDGLNGLELAPSWQLPDRSAIRRPLLEWVRQLTDDARVIGDAERMWNDEQPAVAGRLERVVDTVALADRSLQPLLDAVRQGSPPAPPDVRAWMARASYPSVVRDNVQLFFGRAMVRAEYFDAALELLDALDVESVCDPSVLLFYRAVASHGLVRIEAAASDVARLLEREAELPQRYRDVGRLMHRDLQGVQADSADHIARRMDDIRRRLALGQADSKVRKVQDGVIDSLDKLIKELEAAEQASQKQAGQSGGGQIQSNTPAQDSLSLEGKGPGKVQKKDIGDTPDWGNLPSKQREEALQEIARDFPAHYRDVIQQYFRKLATEDDQ